MKALKPPAEAKNVYIAIGEYEQKPAPGTPPARAEFFAKAKMVDNAREIARQLGEIDNVSVRFDELAGENHGSILPIAVSRAVRVGLSPATK